MFPSEQSVTPAVNDTAIERKRRYGRDRIVGSNGSRVDVLNRVQLANAGVEICHGVPGNRVVGEFYI